MAGKFVSIEEAARLLGVSIDEVNRLVDRKKLFPMRDGASLKFKVDEIERVAASLGDESSRSESLALDLDMPTPEGDDLAIGGSALGGAADAGSQTLVRGGAGAGPGGDLSGLALGDDDEAASESADLALESIIGASSPSLARPASGSIVGSTPGDGDPLTLDLSGIAAGSNAVPGSQATGAGPSPSGSNAGSGFSVPLDGGLSLEGEDLAVSGIELEPGVAPGSSTSELGGSLAGEAFELGTDGGDEESASVVIPTEESGDSSFFATATGESASVDFGEASAIDSASSSMAGVAIPEPSIEMGFSPWQIAGLTCCALVLLTGGLIMFDLAWTIRTPQGTPVSAPLLNALSDAFGWRR